MLGKKLRAARYLRPWNKALAQFLLEGLPYLDYPSTLQFYETITPDLDRDSAALLAANDRFYLLTSVLHRPDALHPWLFERCREVEFAPYDHLDLWARGHYKSTFITFAGSIQEMLDDPDITIGIFSHTAAAAGVFLGQIMRELSSNEDLKGLFPDILYENPERDAMRWSIKEGIIIRRVSNPKEATIEAHAIMPSPTGRHFRILLFDDIIEAKAVSNPEMVRKVTSAWELSDNLGSGKKTRKIYAGTRYSFGDTYGIMLERNAVTPRIYPATDDGKLTGKPVFLDQATWNDKKNTQRSTVAAQMLQNPLAGQENTFRAEWFRPYAARPRTLNVYIMGDPSKGSNKKSDRTAIAVVGIDSAGNKYLLDGYRHRMTLSERWSSLKNLWKHWSKQPGVLYVKVGYERYGQQTDQEYFEERMNAERIHFPIEELSWVKEGNQSKKDRVERLEPDFRNGRFFLPGLIHYPGSGRCLWSIDTEKQTVAPRPLVAPTRQMVQLDASGEGNRVAGPVKRIDEDQHAYDLTLALMEEMTFFPFAPKDDLVDAVSRIYDMDPVPPTLFEDVAASRDYMVTEDA